MIKMPKMLSPGDLVGGEVSEERSRPGPAVGGAARLPCLRRVTGGWGSTCPIPGCSVPLGLVLSPGTIVPGTASGAGGAAAMVGPDQQAGQALTVSFHEPAFTATLGQTHRALLGAGFLGQETPRVCRLW